MDEISIFTTICCKNSLITFIIQMKSNINLHLLIFTVAWNTCLLVFPLIHASRFNNIIGSFDALKGYFAEDIKNK